MDVGARSSPLSSWWQRHGGQVLALAFALAVTVVIVVFRDQLVALRGLGYVGVFLVGILGNATVIFPVPSLAVVFAAGSVLNPLLVGLVSGVGEPLGELTGYLAGYGGSAVIRDGARFQRIKLWMERRGFLTLFVLSAIPNPVFDLAGIAAGMVGFPVAKFLLACWLGKSLKAILVAYLGSLSVDLIGSWLR